LPRRPAQLLTLPRLRLVLIGALVLVAVLGLTGHTTARPQPRPVKKGDKVRVVHGKWKGTLGAVIGVSHRKKVRRRYKIRLAGGVVRRFTRKQIAKRPLVVGDRVRVVSGHYKGKRGPIKRIRPRRVRRRFVVDLNRGPVRRFPRRRLAYLAPKRAGKRAPGALPAPAEQPFAQPSCEPGAAAATTAAQVRAAIQAAHNVCVSANVGDVDLSGLSPASNLFVGTSGGSMESVDLASSSRITLRARFVSVELRGSSFITIEQSIVGGTSSNRVLDSLIFIPEDSDDVTIRDSDIGWTNADNSGNTGYGLRVYGASDRLTVQRNRFHNIAADAIQLGMEGTDTLIDGNEIGYVAPNPGSSEHADNIQVVGNGPNLRITNNWIHHQGWYTESQQTSNSGTMYVHGGETAAMLVENNLFADSLGRVEFGGLGTGGISRSNLTVRRNTFRDLGTAFSGFPGLEWDIHAGANNLLERNVATDPDGGVAIADPTPGHTLIRSNVWGKNVPLDGAGQCTSAACNPAGQEPIGFRKPAGVHW
jgi:ribosomal protein L24